MLKKEKIIKASNKLKSKKMTKLATQNKIIRIIPNKSGILLIAK